MEFTKNTKGIRLYEEGKTKKYLKAIGGYDRLLSTGKYYELVKIIKHDAYSTGVGVVIVNNIGETYSFDSSYFEAKK